jgi:hypothetical protein
MADREFNHFSELADKTKEYKEADSLLVVYNHRVSDAETMTSGFAITKGYGDDEMQYLYGVIRWTGAKTEKIIYYLKYDKDKRKIVAISKQPIP